MDTVQQTLDLRARQVALEEESLTLGIDRYKKEHGRQEEAETGPGRRLIRDCLVPVAQAIEAFVAEARNGKPGKKHTAVRWVEKFPATELAYLTARHCLNAISSGETRVQSVAEAIATSVSDSINYSRFREESPGLYKHLQDVLKKSTSSRHSRNVMASANGLSSFAMIHDSYGTHAADTGILAASLRAAFVEQYNRNTKQLLFVLQEQIDFGKGGNGLPGGGAGWPDPGGSPSLPIQEIIDQLMQSPVMGLLTSRLDDIDLTANTVLEAVLRGDKVYNYRHEDQARVALVEESVQTVQDEQHSMAEKITDVYAKYQDNEAQIHSVQKAIADEHSANATVFEGINARNR